MISLIYRSIDVEIDERREGGCCWEGAVGDVGVGCGRDRSSLLRLVVVVPAGEVRGQASQALQVTAAGPTTYRYTSPLRVSLVQQASAIFIFILFFFP